LLTLPASGFQAYESSSEFNASSILPAELVSGPHHRIDDKVTNDGFLNIYTIKTSFGDLRAVSTAQLKKYIAEINAVALMQEVSKTEEFVNAAKAGGKRVVTGAVDLVTSPVETISGAVSGVGALFKRAGESMTTNRSDTEDNRLKAALGFSTTKRQFAYDFGVDPYSRNTILQENLDDLAWAGFSGGLSATAGLSQVPGGAGTAVTATSGSKILGEVFRNTPPSELRTMNRKKLVAMGVNDEVVDLFINNQNYTPREQTILVAALDSMKNTKNRSEYIKFAVLTDNADMALFRQRQAQMYAGYNKSISSVKEFISIYEISIIKTNDNKVVFNVPLDYTVWTKGLEIVASTITQEVARMKGITDREIWVTGTFSSIAKENLEKLGWTIHEGAGQLLN
jgi:hypothetical protein